MLSSALKNANLTTYDNEFFTLLGPSGCGKTTLLRLIAGFEDITEGNIKLFSEEIITLPPNKRPVNTVFQHYALFPHLNVYENIAFGLKRLNKDNTEIEKRTSEVLELVQMKDLSNRKTSSTRMLLIHGDQDAVVSPTFLLEAKDFLIRNDVEIETKMLNNCDHHIPMEASSAALKYIKGNFNI